MVKQEIFQQLVTQAIENLPDYFLSKLQNVVVVLEACPTAAQVTGAGLGRSQTLLGLYEGVPQTKRGGHYGLFPPDKITIFQKPIEAICKNDAEIINTIEDVVKHEIAHHFGISDARLQQIEGDRD